MSNLKKQIKSDVVVHMKSGAKEKLATLRLLVAEIEKEQIELQVAELTDEQVQNVISRQIKKLNKEIQAYIDVNRGTESQEAEKELLLSYLPNQLTKDEIRKEVEHALELVARGEIDKPMRYLSHKLRGKADMGVVAKIGQEMIKK